jgi:2-keto-4-pentenoate hydratase
MSEGLEVDPAERIRRGMAHQLAARAAQLRAGATHRGWKVAFTTPQSRAAAGVDRSVVGYLTEATELPDGATVPIGGWTRPTIEAELAIHVGEDTTIAAVGAAIEVVDIDLPLDRIEDVVAGGIFHRHYVLGDPDPARSGGDVGGVRIRALLDDELAAAEDDPCSVIGELPEVVVKLAEELERHGERLRAGDVILAGSAIPLQPVVVGQRLRVEAEGLGKLTLSFADR